MRCRSGMGVLLMGLMGEVLDFDFFGWIFFECLC